ncbi:glycosyltransferase [Janibacter sp. G56]|uniref:glycosyltransferase n=1 Tax=Janibacter sp. G56 TaxID=3418717 RepID=UPI003CFFD6E4
MSVGALDLAIDHPVGRVPGADRDKRAVLLVQDASWRLTVPGARTRRGRWQDREELARTLPLLDTCHGLSVAVEPGLDKGGVVISYLHRAAARGTLVTGGVPGPLAARLPFEVRPDTPGVVPGLLEFDARAVAQRRDALVVGLRSRPAVSAVLVTKRLHFLPRIAAMMAAQTYRPLELVVVIHSDEPAPEITAGDVPVRVLSAPTGTTLGAALALGSAAAEGELVTKVDDDDHYGPDHVLDLVLARAVSGAELVGKSPTVVHLEALDTTVRRVFGAPESWVHRVAGGTLLLSGETLRDVGGWADVPRAVDSRLIEAVTGAGGRIYRPHDLGYLYVRHADAEHTWATDVGHFLQSAREQWLGLLSHPVFGT